MTLAFIILGVLILSALVFVHEGGHYLSARAFGVRVTEFMLGLPGPNIGITRGETKFGVTPILLGGYARVCGMEPGEMSPHLEKALAALYRRGTANMEDIAADCGISEDEALEALDELVEWGSCTGPTKKDEFNTYRTPGFTPTKRQLRAAQKAGKPVPQAHVAGEPRAVENEAELFHNEHARQYRSLPFWKRSVILLAGPAVNLLVVFLIFFVVYGVMGFDVLNQETGETVHYNATPWQCVLIGVSYLGVVIDAVSGLFNPATTAETVSQSSSVVGIVALTGEVFSQGLQNGLFFIAAISASLGIMNLIPIPPLDGGKFLVEIIQKIISRPVSAKVQNVISMVGLALFILLFVVLLNQDIHNYVLGG